MFDKMMNRMFRKVEGVVFDMTTNSVGIKKEGSVFSAQKNGNDYELVENIFDEMSATLPAFAKAVPIGDVKEGDLVLNQAGDPFGWVSKVAPKSLKVLKVNGTLSTVIPSKVGLLGQGQTVMVVSSLTSNNGQMDPMIMIMLMNDGEDSDKLLPLLMMQQGQQGNMNPMMMAMLMSKGKAGGSSDTMKNMMLMQMMQQTGDQSSNVFGGMNPMMMAMMMGKL